MSSAAQRYIGKRAGPPCIVEDPAQSAALRSWIASWNLYALPVLVNHDVGVSRAQNRVSRAR